MKPGELAVAGTSLGTIPSGSTRRNPPNGTMYHKPRKPTAKASKNLLAAAHDMRQHDKAAYEHMQKQDRQNYGTMGSAGLLWIVLGLLVNDKDRVWGAVVWN